jgi:hypothetical protein
LYPPRSIHI